MKDAEIIVGAAELAAPNAGMPAANDSAEAATADPHAARRRGLVRALQLSTMLHVRVIVDHTGWLSRDVEIVYRREHGKTITPITVRVGRDARDEDVLADGGALGICHYYNKALEDLRQLAIQLAGVVREGNIAVTADSDLEAAQRELARLDTLISSRQMKYMASGVVRLDRLRSEIAYFEGRHAYLHPIVSAAERDARPSWEADTKELLLDAEIEGAEPRRRRSAAPRATRTEIGAGRHHCVEIRGADVNDMDPGKAELASSEVQRREDLLNNDGCPKTTAR